MSALSGPGHYEEAVRVLDYAEANAAAESDEWYANAMAAAQVHATLALAAATVLRTAGIPADGPTASAWRTATTVDKPTERTAPQ